MQQLNSHNAVVSTYMREGITTWFLSATLCAMAWQIHFLPFQAGSPQTLTQTMPSVSFCQLFLIFREQNISKHLTAQCSSVMILGHLIQLPSPCWLRIIVNRTYLPHQQWYTKCCHVQTETVARNLSACDLAFICAKSTFSAFLRFSALFRPVN